MCYLNKLLLTFCTLTVCFCVVKSDHLHNDNEDNNKNNKTQEYLFTLILRSSQEKTVLVECNEETIVAEGIKQIEIPEQKWRIGLTKEEYETNVKNKITPCNCLLEPLANGALTIEDRDKPSEGTCKHYSTCSQFPWPVTAEELREYEMRISDRLEITDTKGNFHSLVQPMKKVIRIKPGQVTLRCRKRSKNLPFRPTPVDPSICIPAPGDGTAHTISHYRPIIASLIGSLVMNMCIIVIVILVLKKCKGNKSKNNDIHHRSGSRGNYSVARMSYEVPQRPYNNQETNSSTPASPGQYTPLQPGGANNLAMDLNNHIITLNNKQNNTVETSDNISTYKPYYNNNTSKNSGGNMKPVSNMPLNHDNHQVSEYDNDNLGELYTIQEEPNSPDMNQLRLQRNDNLHTTPTQNPVSGLRRQSSSYDYIIDDDDSEETDKNVKRNSSHKYLELT